MRPIKIFAVEQDQHLIANYLTIPVKHLALSIGKPYTSTRRRITELGLIIPAELARKFRGTHGAVKKELVLTEAAKSVKKEIKFNARVRKGRKKEAVLKTKPIDNTGKIWVQIDRRTWVHRDINRSV